MIATANNNRSIVFYNQVHSRNTQINLGMIEYEGVIPGLADDRSLHFLATFDVRDGVAVVATLTTVNDATFDALRPIVEPFLRSLQAT